MTQEEVERLVDETIAEFRDFELDPSGRRKGHDLPPYLVAHRHEYVRTVKDVVEFAERNGSKKILEIGAFFGLVCVCLAKLGYEVTAADFPDYMSLPAQQERYGRYGIEIAAVRLQDYVLPFADEQFDAVIMCEVLEHLNFNPLPLVKEINRIGAPGSLFYVSLPNLAYYRNRLGFLFGKSMLHSIQGYFDQLDPNDPTIANGHWKEYTAAELKELLERMGYEIERHYYFSKADAIASPTLRNRLTRAVFRACPSFKENQTALAIRRRRTEHTFQIPDTVHEQLDVL